MNLRALAGHTIDLDALPEAPTVLDVGCRGFDFPREILRLRPYASVIAVDADCEVTKPPDLKVKFSPIALTGGMRSLARMAKFSTGEGNFLTELDVYYDAQMVEVACTTIEDFTWMCEVVRWDVVKLDCEGSEFGILENWPGPIASQISVEFHDSGYTPGYGPDYDYTKMFERLAGFGYRVVKHDLSKQGEGTGHWDSLIVLG